MTRARRCASSTRAGVLSAADVHVATLLGALAGTTDGDVLLAAALAVRAPRVGHVFVDLASVAATASVESDEQLDLAALPWPEAGPWVRRVADCAALVACGEPAESVGDAALRPLRLIGTRLYLDRYWREERQVAGDLLALDAAALRQVDLPLLADGLARMFTADGDQPQPDGDQLQRVAAACAVLRSLAVIAGGPGTGKTTTVARIIALLHEQAHSRGQPPPLVALAAPTGKAAARLQESVHTEAAALTVAPEVREALLALRASTIHRLLGWRPGSHSRFRHDRANRLPHDVVIVDETSMVSLTLMARLLEAVRGDARLVLVGDPEQLTAIEAGAVLRDVVGPAAVGPRMSPATRVAVTRALGTEPATMPAQGSVAFGDGIVVLRRVHRYGPAIARVAGAIRRGDADALLETLRCDAEEVVWIVPDGAASLEPVRSAAVEAGRAVIEAARAGDGAAALGALGSFRALCAHRHGPHGVERWTDEIERWLTEAIPGFEPDSGQYVGRPLLITRNDYELALYNGDSGVVVAGRPGPGQRDLRA